MVGTVLVKDGEIIGRGHHARAGLDHAEVAAIKDALERGNDPRGCTLYVNLEPCCTHGHTPPCTDACIDTGVSRVVAAMVDPNPRVRGGGLKRLHEAGIEVVCGVLEDEARRLNAPFCTFETHRRPHITVKVAMSLDGKLATAGGDSFPMTGPEARRVVHLLRDRVDGILVGRRTVEIDNPRLTCRLEDEDLPGGPMDPVRVVLDPELKGPLDAQIYHQESAAPTWVVAARDHDPAKRAALDALGIEVIPCPRGTDGRLEVGAVLEALAERGLCSILVEGGAVTAASFFDAGLVDVWIAHVAPILVGGEGAPGPLAGQGVASLAERVEAREPLRVRRLGRDIEIVAAVAGHVYGLD
jgi:diaminohydroxyphosphoribosylaminopyrimidine deaminase/5-amino-6-(5-phosphoribosylamino)uracil reductase